MKKALALSVLMFSAVVSAAESDYDEFITNNSVTYEKTDGNGQASLSIVNPVVNLSTTKDYAQYIMDSYQGWDLKPVIDLRGFSFKFVDNAPCSGLVTYFDGRAYLLFKACGKVSEAAETEGGGLGSRFRQGNDDQRKGVAEHDVERRCAVGHRGGTGSRR